MVKRYDECAQSQSEEDTELWVSWPLNYTLMLPVATLASAHLVKPFSPIKAGGWSRSSQMKTD